MIDASWLVFLLSLVLANDKESRVGDFLGFLQPTFAVMISK